MLATFIVIVDDSGYLVTVGSYRLLEEFEDEWRKRCFLRSAMARS